MAESTSEVRGDASPVVTVSTGALRGRLATSASGRRYHSFHGIRFAKPPTGPLRFKPPVPAEPWDGEYDATKEGNECAQLDFWTWEYKGDEDCLFLNVYTPEAPADADSGRWPVMVWVHGGGFRASSGTAREYGPDYLVDLGVALVTFNYRLGPLGFATTGDAECVGNMGLRDIQLALQWVQKNIEYFGGDPSNVTVFGESAGGIVTHGLLFMESAVGLFHRVICQSGVTFPAALNSPVVERTRRLAQQLGCPPDASSRDLVDFLRQQPVRDLVEKQMSARSDEEREMLEMFPFVPMLEPAGVTGAELTRDPAEVLKSGRFRQVPIIIGINSREGLDFIRDIMEEKHLIPELDKNFHKILPRNVPMREPLRVFVGEKIKNFYFGDRHFDESTLDAYADVRGDMLFLYPSVLAGRLHSRITNGVPVYMYHFAVEGRLNIFKKKFGAEAYSGASHGDELCYLFTTDSCKDVQLEPESVEAKTIVRMTRMWTNFAKTGDPTPDGTDAVLGNIKWPASGGGKLQYLNIGNDGLRVVSGLYQERVAFWDGLNVSPVLRKVLEFGVCCYAFLRGLLRRD